MLEQTSLRAGCALMAVTVAAEAQPLRARAGETFREWRARLAEALREGGVAPERAEAVAAGLLAACEGALALARAEGSLTPFELMAAEQEAVVLAATRRRRSTPRNND
jgi:TetR/AcrR family transcriptional repressor of lmrAB and yxaGH operons